MRTLTRENYIVTGTDIGVDAMDLPCARIPIVVILDLSMPSRTASETLKRLHRQKDPSLR